jgi:hypothetical protein
MRKWFYEKNDELLKSAVNKTFEELLWMTEAEFQTWVAEMRSEVIRIWDQKGIPPRVGFSEQEIVEQFREMRSYPVHHQIDGFESVDQETGEKDCVRNSSVLGNAANQWFPTMMATKINYTDDTSAGLSIYDHFKEPELLQKMITYGRRHFKRDSFYHYSYPIKVFVDGDNITEYMKKYFVEPKNTAVEWIKAYESKRSMYENTFDYWLEAKEEGGEYTGYGENLRNVSYLRLTRDELTELGSIVPDKCKTNIDYKNRDVFQIRVFKRGQRVFPIGLKAFRISVCQYAVNFPPLTAKYLYEKFTEHIKTQSQINIWDPSSGWGGRILGAMSVENDTRHIHYIGTDPNTDHNTTDGRTKYHELADFYNKHTDSPFATNPPHTYEFYQCGSEDMKTQPDFQQYKGKLDLVFTSPPYFAKELYSDDPTQSATKFNTFDTWVDGFLRPTLETAVEWLAPNRYLLWNIADAKFGNEMLPLEKVSCDILESLGMKLECKLKMVLAQMPGGNRVDSETGKPSAKNFCRIKASSNKFIANSIDNTSKKTKQKDIWFKYEPIFVFKKV